MRGLLFLLYIVISISGNGQKKSGIVSIIDDLTIRWDQGAIDLKTYQGIQEFCLDDVYQSETIELLDEIHHWDTTLYYIVQQKFDTKKDREAAETIIDIERLESEYSTINFKKFIQDECKELKVIEDSFDPTTVKQYEKGIRQFEKELVKYVNSITFRIDIIDEHIHHLKLD